MSNPSRPIAVSACLLAMLLSALACAPRSQREAIAMARTAYREDRCKGVLVRLDEARRMSATPLDQESRRAEVECSVRLESARISERRVAALCQDFDWSSDGIATAIIKNAAVFPVDPAARGTGGYVRFALEIDDEGRVMRTRVLESEPEGIFDSPAEKGVAKWRYCPRKYLAEGVRYPETAEMRFRNRRR
ncbi:MAG: energy transducer TonB [Myxococcales bacterium]|nr:energy transducer TonB [Myxococcales bacterium]MDH5306477.1 energy transducer TonB [Myxococcales bacterium]